MNGSRSAPPRHGDRSSLEALNRTIEGLEARIQGLMAGSGRPAYSEQTASEPLARQPRASVAPAPVLAPLPPAPVAAPAHHASADPARSVLAEIRERQRMLEQAAERPRRVETTPADMGYRAERSRPQDPRTASFSARPPQAEPLYAAPAVQEPPRQRTVASRLSEATQRSNDAAASDFTDALAKLRQDLKRDISDGLSREMKALREEVRAIKAEAEDQRFVEDVHSDLARLAQGIDQLAMQSTPETAGLRAEFEELRAVMESLAREDSLQQMQNQWQGLEERIQEADASALREELVALAYRIDEIRNQLGLMADSPVIRALEEKLLNLAGMMEKLGARMQPSDAAIGEHFGLLDQRLDEISRAIAANARTPSPTAMDDVALQRLEGRLGALLEHVEAIGRATSDNKATDGLSLRIELLAGKIEELAEEQVAARLEERIVQLTAMVQQLQSPGQSADLTGFLSEISRKIDALDTSFAGHGIGERLEYLVRRIDEMEQPQGSPAGSEAAFSRIEDRLTDIATRLDETSSTPPGNEEALRGLEAQIAHLSTLISQPTATAAEWPPEFDSRMSAIEGYMATNDEYIVEAARQAAETVIEAYSRNLNAGGISSGADIAALSGLAEDLKHLEDLARSSDTRTHQTFEALHGTLVQIADRLDRLEGQTGPGTARAPLEEEAPRHANFAASAPSRQQATAAPVTAPANAPALSAELVDELATAVAPQTDARLRETSAISSTLAEHVPAPEDYVASGEQDEQKPAKASLLSGLSRRFRPGAKQETAPVTRAVVEEAPSIDPSAVLGDVLPPERENDLLEPGSGAPDVKKILERVRASQAAGEFDREKTGERADYIAAARRAAKAAAQEADPSQLGSLPKADAKPAKGKAMKGTSAFSQHRRPILMAVGAVLLALMAMPLIKTVTTGPQVPEVASVETPAPEQAPAEPVAPAEETAPDAGMSAIDNAPQDNAPPADLTETTPGTDGGLDNGVATSDGATDGAAPEMGASEPLADQAPTDAPIASFDEQPAPAPAAAPAQTVEQQPAAITVPAGIEPKSLADAANAGDANALFEIGARFTDGRGVQPDLAEASKWYRLSADRGLAPAQYRLGNILEKGTGVVRNLGEAVSYYRLAAEAGNASAMHNLAVLYASGAAGQPDYPAAVDWFRNAANHGVADSQFNLAILYARGNGVQQDLEESYKWFGAAAQGGDQDAAQKRDEVAKSMRKEQLDSARAKLDAWKALPLDPKANSVNLPDEWASGKGVTTASVDMSKAIRNIQAILNKNGFEAGTPDGKMGAKTIAAIKAFQSSIGQEATGKVNDALVRELLARNG